MKCIADTSIFVALALVPWSAMAQTRAALPADEIVVVATRSPESLDEIGRSVTLLDAQAIERSQAVAAADLLAATPGISFSRNGGPGSQTALSIRGAGSDQTAVLIDGVQMNDPSSIGGGFDFGKLLLGDIDRIEILRGAQSTLYGSEAMGGVVNIITRKPGERSDGNLQAEAGSLNTGLLQGGIDGRIGRLSGRLAGSRYSTDSVSSFDRRYGGTETDPYRNTSFSGRARYDFTDTLQLDLRAYYTEDTLNYDGYPPPDFTFADEGDYGTTRQLVDYSGFNFDLFGGRFKNRIAYEHTRVDRADFLSTVTSPMQNDAYAGVNSRYEYQGTLQIGPRYEAVFGLQQEDRRMESEAQFSAPAHYSAGEDSLYAQIQAEPLLGLSLIGGVRRDRYDSFGQHDTGSLAVAWSLPSATVLRASWSEGYKAPSLYQLFSPYGNGVLRPEQSAGWDAGVQQSFGHARASLSATYFSTDFENLIGFQNCPGDPVCLLPGHSSGYYANTDRARSEGIELQTSVRLNPKLMLSANYSRVDAEDRTPGSPSYGEQLVHRPRHVANASLSYASRGVAATLAARYSGPSRDVDFNAFPPRNVRLGSYTLVDLRASYPVNAKLRIYGRIDNLFDRQYETAFQYGTWGRTGTIGLRANFR
ncbi:MAG TPA: TonB-dependent receptor [Gammaproteobacteria bacterium]|nr:TonB-dependent receptor [Gammaproteobacteria bacterium]